MTERVRLPDTRESITRKITITHSRNGDGSTEELDIYVIVGLYPDGRPGEVFIRAGKIGGTISGLLDALAVCLSIGLQSGVPLDYFTVKLRGMRFEPSGAVNLPDARRTSSIVDAIMRWLESRFLSPDGAETHDDG